MVKVFTTALVLFCVVISISVVVAAAESIDKSPEGVKTWFQKLNEKKEKITELQIFLHEGNGAINQTVFPIVQPNVSLSSPSSFGQVNMVDDVLRESIDPNSKVLGRYQGIGGYASLDEYSMVHAFNLVFTSGEYNGSSLAVHGSFRFADQYHEMEIIGGTGVFRLARGILTVNLRSFDGTTGVLISEFNIVVVHY